MSAKEYTAKSVEEALEEANMVIELLAGRPITGPVAFDWEMQDSSYRVYGIFAFCRWSYNG